MGLLSNFKKGIADIQKAAQLSRSIETLTAMYEGTKYQNQEPDFLNLQGGIISTNLETVGLGDFDVSPKDMYDMIHKDPYFSGLFEQLVEALFKNGFYFRIKQDDKGKLLGSEAKVKEYTQKLRDINYEDLITKQVYGERADGGGNVLLFTTKTPKGIEFRVEPFLDMGRPRVKVFGNNKLKKITKYQVVDTDSTTVFDLNAEMNVVHSRYTAAGDYRFSTNPAKKAVYWFILKKYLAGANLATFKNGFQSPVIASPDYSALTALVNAMGSNNKVGDAAKIDYLKDPIAFLARQSVLDDEVLREMTGDARKTNTFLKLRMPYTFQNVGRSNNDMQTLALIELCDMQMGYALRTSKGVLNTMDSKYANAEVEVDNWDELVLDPLKTKIEKITKEFYLPILVPDFDSEAYEFRFGRNPNQEDIDIYNAKSAHNQGIANIITSLSNVAGYKYNLETNEIEEVAETVVEEKVAEEVDQTSEKTGEEMSNEKDNTNDVERGVSNNLETVNGKVEKKKTFAERAINSPDFDRFQALLNTNISKTLKKYSAILATKDSPESALSSFKADFPSVTSSGLTVNTLKLQLLKFARIGIEDFEKTTGEQRMFRAGDDFVYPEEILFLIDTKSQLLLKGWDSLNKAQKKVMSAYYNRYKKYKGLDEELSVQVNTILSNGLSNLSGIREITEILDDTVENIALHQSKLIAETETAQAIESTRYQMYHDAEFDEKRWLNVHDNLVRQGHLDNSADEWIPIGEKFRNGEYSPADAIRCRCSLQYRRAV